MPWHHDGDIFGTLELNDMVIHTSLGMAFFPSIRLGIEASVKSRMGDSPIMVDWSQTEIVLRAGITEIEYFANNELRHTAK